MRKSKVLLVFFIILSHYLLAQKRDSTDIFEMSLEDILNTKITVASKTELAQRETPAIVSVITREEIHNMGARDITDILNQIPGFTFGVDVENSIGISARGNWALEGKILILLDGQEMNELLYANTMIGQNYDVTQIERVEIIRGPGSSIYGGYAELGVINIITKNGKQLKGLNTQVSYGFSKNSAIRKNVSLSIGNSSNKLEYSIKGFYGKGIRSDQTYTDFLGTSIDLSQNSGSNPTMINANLKAGNFNARIIYDGYSVETVDWYVEIKPKAVVDFSGWYVQTDYKFLFGKNLSITPQVNFKTGIPWKTPQESTYAPYSVSATRVSPKLNVNWNPSDKINLVGGLDSYFDNGKLNYAHDVDPTGYFPNHSNQIDYNNIGLFAQGLVQTKIANITIGAREDIHSQFGSAFSPRLGLTKQFDAFHVKLLYSKAFRAPTIETLRVNPDLKPEKTYVIELEMGYKINENMFFTANLFDISISNTIYYFALSTTNANFNNGRMSGSRGYELEYKLRYNWGYFNINYAHYNSDGKNEIELYSVPSNSKASLSAPQNRVNINSSFKLNSNFTINPSFNILSSRYGYGSLDADGNSVLKEFDPSAFANLFLNYTNVSSKGFSMGLGIYNIFDTEQVFIQPYNGYHAPMPGLGREIMIRLSYNLDIFSRN